MNPNPTPEEKLQRLLRLKRYEQPPEGYAEVILEKFQRRQRSEILRSSTWSILTERLGGFLQLLRRPVVIWSAGAAYAAVLLTLWLLPRPTHQGGSTFVIGGNMAADIPVSTTPAPPTAHPVSAPQPGLPGGKRRTSIQDQDKAPLIGPEERKAMEDENLRDL